MRTLRISATDIDALRRFRGDEEADLAGLLAQLRRERPPTEAMKAGTALHKALEDAKPGEMRGCISYADDEDMDGAFTFDFEFEGELDLPPVREMKATRDYDIDGCIVTLVGKVDAVHGKRVDDHKLTSSYDAERFLASYQWRIYLEVFGADEFRWNIFEGREGAPRHWTIRALHKLRAHRYPGMSSDVAREVRLFLEFTRDHLPERIKWEPEPWEYLAYGG